MEKIIEELEELYQLAQSAVHAIAQADSLAAYEDAEEIFKDTKTEIKKLERQIYGDF